MLRALSALAVVFFAATVVLAEGDPPPVPSCVSVSGQAQYKGLAYHHTVYVRNGCDQTVTCYVSTDVDPSPEYKLVVKPSQEESVVTRTNSPAREFKARARCTMQAASK